MRPGETQGQPSFMSYAWYSEILKSAGSRIQKYQQFDIMDSDVDIYRALDTIAEEISTKNSVNELPFDFQFHNEDGSDVTENFVTTLRASLRHWTTKQDLENRIFRIARCCIKYGDCFFQKTSDFAKWRYIDPHNVLGMEVDEKGEVVAYHIQKGAVDPKTQSVHLQTDIIPAAGIIHFTLSDDMGPAVPFGESVLQPIIKVFRQLAMLEDAAIIYRIVRAPERRIFYIDVGNMPAQRQKQYLETVKNDIRQRKTPNAADGSVDATYNPMSTQEDYFLPVTANGRGSRIETLPGGQNLGENFEMSYFQERIFRGLRIPTSYMSAAATGGATYNDGKVGVAYIEELRFANYVRRLQNKIEKIFDEHFKLYLKSVGIRIDSDTFSLRLPDPQNFAINRQAALNSDLISTFTTADSVKYLSKQYIMENFLGMSEDDIKRNEMLLKQELGITDTGDVSAVQQMYDPAVFENREPIKIEDEAPEEDAGGDEGGGSGLDSEGGLDMGGDEPPADDSGLDLPQ